MTNHIRLMGIILTVFIITLACQFGGGFDGRTYYESLNLETPEDALETFAEAFQREDFMMVYLVLDSEAQRLLRYEFNVFFSYEHLIGEDVEERLMDDLDFRRLSETQNDGWYIFDQIMLYAAGEDDLLIDLRGDLDILDSEVSETPDGEDAVDLIVRVDGVDGEVIFRMLQDSDDRWRVYFVSAPDEGVVSWPAASLNESE
ncbi:MAG: hypothetical protein FVQ83_13390 [Chloroflexi bacterium]|nr:hypothetical protein [Chloroflexota bacterium]